MLTHWQKSGNSKLCLDAPSLAPTNARGGGVKAPTDEFGSVSFEFNSFSWVVSQPQATYYVFYVF